MSVGAILGWTALLAFLPISELRGAIPFGIAQGAVQGLPWYGIYPFAVLVNALVAPVCWLFLSTLHRLLYNAGGLLRWYRTFFDRFVVRAREKLRPGVETWGWLGLTIFVAIPLPMTGAWTGTLGAWVLGFGKGRTLLAVFLGVLIAGAIVTAVTVLGIKALDLFINSFTNPG